jgi:alkaline phosphatase/outer membrane protein assembly factor BamB
MRKPIFASAALLAIASLPAWSQAKNVILFLGDGVGVSSLNAASIYGYGRAQALYLQRMPRLALADSSSAKEWVTDGAAAATAMATGIKTRNGVVSQSASAERDIRDGDNLQTILEVAAQRGLSTGIISNDDRTGVTLALVSAFYAHVNNRQRAGDIFEQLLNPRVGNGPDVVIGTGRKLILEQTSKAGHNIASEVPAKGYSFVNSLDAVSQLDATQNRVMALFDDADFDVNRATQLAIAHLSKNPKGFFLVVFSDCHLSNARKTLTRIIDLDKAVQDATEKHSKDTLVVMTADHSYDLRIKGEALAETAKWAPNQQQIAQAISLEEQHTAEEVPVIAAGPGSNRVRGWISNTDVYHVMMSAFGWEQYRILTRLPVPGDGGWDYITVDGATRRVYTSHDTVVNVTNADTGVPIGVISDTPGVHGIAIASSTGHGFTSNGREDKVSMFDTETLKLIRKIDVGKGPDGIFFDAASGRVFINNHGSHDISAIDAATGQVVGTVAAAGDGEQMVAGRDGLLYVNLEDKSEVLAFRGKTLEVVSRFPIGVGKTPTGLAFDAQNNRLFVGCRSKSLVVMDAANGKVITSLPIGAGVDAAGFDVEGRFIFASNGDGTLNIFHQKSADQYEDTGAVVTQAGAKTMAFDPTTKRVYLPVADTDTVPPPDASQKAQRKIRPGSFTVLVGGRS